MKFDKEFLQELANEDHDDGVVEVINTELVDASRWSLIYLQVFKIKDTGKYYRTSFRTAATEIQDETPYEYKGDLIECEEVEPVQKTIIVYEPVKATGENK